MKKFALLLALILAVPLYAHAQDLQVTDLVDFQSPSQPSLQMLFYTQFVFDPASGQIVPGTMTYSVTDPFGLGPFAAPKSDDGSSGFFNFIGPNNTWIQIGNEYGSPLPWPSPGTYGSMDTVLLCGVNGGTVASGCSNYLADAGYTPANNGTLTFREVPAETPEPSSLALLAAGGLLFGLLELIRRRV
jgi:PEP-CTERM motif